MFELQFLGTCACDYSPKLWNECKDRFDPDARRASSVLFHNRFLIDCGPHCLDSMQIAGIAQESVTDLFLTHLHSDHFNLPNIAALAGAKERPLRIWVSEDAAFPAVPNTEVIKMEKLFQYDVDTGFTVTALSANHDPKAFPQHLLFEMNGKKFLYACDGAWFMTASYNFLKQSQLSLLVLDATCGDYEGDFRMAEHNSIPMIRLMLPSLKKVGIVGENTEIYLSHLAPSLHKTHAETVEIVKPLGIKVAYDGLKIKF